MRPPPPHQQLRSTPPPLTATPLLMRRVQALTTPTELPQPTKKRRPPWRQDADVDDSVITELLQGGQPPGAGPQPDVPKPTGDLQAGGQLRPPVLADSSDRRQQPTGDLLRVAGGSRSQDVSRTRPPDVDVV